MKKWNKAEQAGDVEQGWAGWRSGVRLSRLEKWSKAEQGWRSGARLSKAEQAGEVEQG